MAILGITGGIASGKSAFCQLLLERVEADSFDADACARELLDEDDAVRDQVLKKIHPEAYDRDGKANRTLLRELIYHDAAKKRTLESILHPVIRQRWSRQALEASAAGRLFVVDLPLLFETNAESLFDRIVTVACSLEVQLARLFTHRGFAPEISRKIIATQMPLDAKIARSHHVVWNDGSLETLTAQTDIFSRYLHVRSG